MTFLACRIYKNEDKTELPFVDYQQIDFSPEGIERMRSTDWTNLREAKIVEKEKVNASPRLLSALSFHFFLGAGGDESAK